MNKLASIDAAVVVSATDDVVLEMADAYAATADKLRALVQARREARSSLEIVDDQISLAISEAA
jgi:hypothetical protein